MLSGPKVPAPSNRKKIELIFDFFARQIVGSAMKLWADGHPLSYFAITGGLAHSGELVSRIETLINGRIPLIKVPGSFEPESLAAGCLRAWYEPEKLKSYIEERDTLKKTAYGRGHSIRYWSYSNGNSFTRKKTRLSCRLTS